MKIYKFGGSVLKDAQNFIEASKIIIENRNSKKLIIVISAIGKTTSILEEIFFCEDTNSRFQKLIDKLKSTQTNCLAGLKGSFLSAASEYTEKALQQILSINSRDSRSHSLMLSFGEMISSFIFIQYLKQLGMNCILVDAPSFIKTDSSYINANIDFEETSRLLNKNILPYLQTYDIIVTQGFISSNAKNDITLLGKEGSDFTATLLGKLLHASKVVLWKDVFYMNADPKIFKNVEVIDSINLNDAFEIAKLGSKLIYYKALNILRNSDVELYIKCFDKPHEKGTKIANSVKNVQSDIYIFKSLENDDFLNDCQFLNQIINVSDIQKIALTKGLSLLIIYLAQNEHGSKKPIQFEKGRNSQPEDQCAYSIPLEVQDKEILSQKRVGNKIYIVFKDYCKT